MPVTCTTCGLKFETIAATIDHVRDTNQGQIGELRADLGDIFNSDDPRDIQTLNDAMSEFSHRQLRDRYGNLLPLGAHNYSTFGLLQVVLSTVKNANQNSETIIDCIYTILKLDTQNPLI